MGLVVYLEQNSVTTEELEFLHSVGMKHHDGIVIIHSLVDDKPVWRLLAFQDRRAKVSLRSLTEKTESVRF